MNKITRKGRDIYLNDYYMTRINGIRGEYYFYGEIFGCAGAGYFSSFMDAVNCARKKILDYALLSHGARPGAVVKRISVYRVER